MQNDNPGGLKKWLVAARPFALPASVMPVIFGAVLAAVIGKAEFHWIYFILSLVGMAILHTGGNLLNDVFDYKKGIDQQVNPVSGAVVRGWISTTQALGAGLFLLLTGSLIGLYLFTVIGSAILWIGIFGITIGIIYTWGPLPLKFNALGDLAVFFNFGVLGALGSWTVQTGQPSWTPVIWSIPMSILVTAILHSNNWRDISNDANSGIKTMASILGDQRSETYFTFLLLSPFAVILAIIAVTHIWNLDHRMPYTFLITLLAVPVATKLIGKGKRRATAENPLDFLALDGATAQFNTIFGLLCVAALGLNYLIA